MGRTRLILPGTGTPNAEAERLESRPPARQRYHRAVHTSSRELAALAGQTRPGLLILTHQLGWGAADAELLAEIAALNNGRVDPAVFA